MDGAPSGANRRRFGGNRWRLEGHGDTPSCQRNGGKFFPFLFPTNGCGGCVQRLWDSTPDVGGVVPRADKIVWCGMVQNEGQLGSVATAWGCKDGKGWNGDPRGSGA